MHRAGERRSRWTLQILLIYRQYVVLQCDDLNNKSVGEAIVTGCSAHDLLIVTKLEIVLHHIVLILLNLVFVKLAFLHFGKVPSDDVLTSRRDNRIFYLSSLVKPVEGIFVRKHRSAMQNTYRAGEKLIS